MSPVLWFYIHHTPLRDLENKYGPYVWIIDFRYGDGSYESFFLSEENMKIFRAAGKPMMMLAGYYWPKKEE